MQIVHCFSLDSMTLTQTERGYPPVVEHVGKPVAVRREMGIDWSDTESYRSTMVHHSWRKSDYLQKRKEELKDVIDELCPHKPVCVFLGHLQQKLDLVSTDIEGTSPY